MAWDAPRPLPGSTLESRTTFPGSRTSSQVGSAPDPPEGQLPPGRQLQIEPTTTASSNGNGDYGNGDYGNGDYGNYGNYGNYQN